MRKLLVLIAAIVVALPLLVAAGPRQASDVDHEATVAKGETVTVEGGVGANGGFWEIGGDEATCSPSDNTNMCERVLVKFESGGAASFDFTPAYPSDFDVYAFESDADGSQGEELASAAGFWNPIMCDPIGFSCPNEAASWDQTTGGYVLIIIHYYMAGGDWTMDLALA